MSNRERKRQQPAGPTPLSQQVAIVRAFLPDFGDTKALATAEGDFAELEDSAQRFTLASQNAVLIDLGREQLRALKTVVNALDEANELLSELVAAGGGGPETVEDGVPQPDGDPAFDPEEPREAPEHVEAELLVHGKDGEGE